MFKTPPLRNCVDKKARGAKSLFADLHVDAVERWQSKPSGDVGPAFQPLFDLWRYAALLQNLEGEILEFARSERRIDLVASASDAFPKEPPAMEVRGARLGIPGKGNRCGLHLDAAAG